MPGDTFIFSQEVYVISDAEITKRLNDITTKYYEYKKLFKGFVSNLEDVIKVDYKKLKVSVDQKGDCEIEIKYLDRIFIISFSVFINDKWKPLGVLTFSLVKDYKDKRELTPINTIHFNNNGKVKKLPVETEAPPSDSMRVPLSNDIKLKEGVNEVLSGWLYLFLQSDEFKNTDR